MQKTDFDFNIIVADDCSTDDTLTKIKALTAGSKLEIIYLESEKNLGIKDNYKRAFAACHAEYIAVMEGDDYWTTPLRLQKHVDFLDNHRECVMSQNSYIAANFEEAEIWIPPIDTSYKLMPARDIAKEGHAGCQFSSCVYRARAIKELPEERFAGVLE
jgi:glycosyltransferase involved in cell wall biosynthesis